MANYATLKEAIQQVIKTNGNEEITGALLQQSLLAMINSLGGYYQFAGIATPSTNPGTPDQNVFYLASTAGTYSNFGSIVIAENEAAILKYNGTWLKDSSGFATSEIVNQLEAKVGVIDFNSRLNNYGKITLTAEDAINGYYTISGANVVFHSSNSYKCIALKNVPADKITWTPPTNSGISEGFAVSNGRSIQVSSFRNIGIMPLRQDWGPVFDIYLNFFGAGFIDSFTIYAKNGVIDTVEDAIHGNLEFSLQGYIKPADGTFASSSSWRSTDFIPVDGGDVVKIQSNSYSSCLAAFYDKTKTFLSALTSQNNAVEENTVTVPSGAYYMRCSTVKELVGFIEFTGNIYEKIVEALNKTMPVPVIGDDSIKANNIDSFYPVTAENAAIAQVLTDEYYSEATSGYTISKTSFSGLGSMEITGIVVGKKYFLKIGQEIGTSVMRNYFIFAKSTTEAVITAAQIPDYVELYDNAEHIYIITIPPGCTRVYTAGNVSTFNTFWVKDFGKKALRWLLLDDDNISPSLLEGIKNAQIRLFDSIEKPIVFNGKTLVAFGDSITNGVSSPNLVNAGNNKYISLFCAHTGATLDNKSKSGACITYGANEIESIYTTLTSFTGIADIIWIAGGVNDWQEEVAIGEFDDAVNTTLYGALNLMCAFLKTNYPNAVVIFVTPIPTTSKTTFGVTHPDNLDEYRKAIQEVAAKNGYNVVNGADLGLPDKMTPFGNTMFDETDRVHPTLAGHAMYFRSLCGKLL